MSTTFPSLSSTHILGAEFFGALSLKSINTVSPVLAILISINPPPPNPDEFGSATPKANPAATAASIAFPPFFKTSIPILLASYLLVETIPTFPSAPLPVLTIFPFSSNGLKSAFKLLKEKNVTATAPNKYLFFITHSPFISIIYTL